MVWTFSAILALAASTTAAPIVEDIFVLKRTGSQSETANV